MIESGRIALAVQQPWAELIIRGIKTIEVRSTSCRPGRRVYVYASSRPSTLPDAADAAIRHGLGVDSLPRRVIVGAVDLVGCRPAETDDAAAACVRADRLADRRAWVLARPERLDPPLRVSVAPYGVWFYPFGRLVAD